MIEARMNQPRKRDRQGQVPIMQIQLNTYEIGAREIAILASLYRAPLTFIIPKSPAFLCRLGLTTLCLLCNHSSMSKLPYNLS